jgi:cytochrome c oxidase subunit 1/cytochrome c oxidase subunit I+III
MSAPTLPSRPVIDVSDLPGSELDHRALIWWGNLMLLAIETTMFALLIAAYFYVRGNFHAWPPPQTNWAIARYNTNPALPLALINLAVIVLSCIPMAVADRMALRMRTGAVAWGLALCIVLGLAAIGLRFKEFFGLNFRWDDNAYGSMVWTILGLHLTHLIVGTLENALMLAWIAAHGMDEKHARDIRVNAVYWYWIGAMWVLLFAIVYLGPRVT